MKRLLLLLASLIITANVYSQVGFCSKETAGNIKNQTIKIIDDDTQLSKSIQEAFKNNWTYSKYEVISKEEFDKNVYNSEVLVYGYFENTQLENRKYIMDQPAIGLAKRYRGTKKYHAGKDLTLYFPYTEKAFPKEYELAYLSIYIKLLNDYLFLLDENKIKNRFGFFKIINSQTSAIAKQTFYINKENLTCSEEDITSVYDFNYKIVDSKTISDAILNKEDVVILNVLESSKNVNIFVFSPKDNKYYYYMPSVSSVSANKGVMKYVFKLLGKKQK